MFQGFMTKPEICIFNRGHTDESHSHFKLWIQETIYLNGETVAGSKTSIFIFLFEREVDRDCSIL